MASPGLKWRKGLGLDLGGIHRLEMRPLSSRTRLLPLVTFRDKYACPLLLLDIELLLLRLRYLLLLCWSLRLLGCLLPGLTWNP